MLEQRDDWVLQVDLTIPGDGQKKNTPFPAHIGDGESVFSSRPDLIIFSDKLKHILYIELTSPWEGPRMEELHKEKMEKYRTAGLHSIPGWSTTPLCVEVGARGTTSNTFHHMCKALGMSSRESKRLGKKAADCSRTVQLFHLPQSESHGMGPTASIHAVPNDNSSWRNNSYVAPTSSC